MQKRFLSLRRGWVYTHPIMTKEKVELQGRMWGCILLIAGCCIGAGMLGLPVMTARAGFFPSTLFFFVSWLFMLVTGGLLLEVNLWVGKEHSLMTMARQTLGKGAEWVVAFLFMFLFYSLLVAYIAGGGEIIAETLETLSGMAVAPGAGSFLLLLFFGACVTMGTRVVDGCNRLMIGGLVLFYLLLMVMGLPHVKGESLRLHNWHAAFFIIPGMIISFGYHNLVPTVSAYLEGKPRLIWRAIVVGSLIPLLVYLIWQMIVLGVVPLESQGVFKQALDDGEMVTRLLKGVVGSPWVVYAMHVFSFFAIITSFLGVALSFVGFLADGWNLKGKFLPTALVLLPPFLFGLIYPHIFYVAIGYAGGFATVILFGIIPALMVRHIRKEGTPSPFVMPGGALTLWLVMLFALFVMIMEVWFEWF